MSEWKETELGKIPTSWNIYKVNELVKMNILEKPLDGNHGEIHPKQSDFLKSGIPFIMASDLVNGRLKLDSCKFISKRQADSLRKGFSLKGDVLLTHKATLGRTAIVGDIHFSYIVLSPQVTYYRVLDKTKLYNKFLKYYFDSNIFQETLFNYAS
ncbi:MAG: restriction endonuclease subunit S, partial [Fidelibacterota bacterium]